MDRLVNHARTIDLGEVDMRKQCDRKVATAVGCWEYPAETATKALGRREDLYQLHAYSSAFAAPVAARAYPAISVDLSIDERNSP